MTSSASLINESTENKRMKAWRVVSSLPLEVVAKIEKQTKKTNEKRASAIK